MFVGHVAPARSVAAAETVLEAVDAEHPDATHVVPAYRVRAAPLREWASDAGEPSGSAGKPVLNVLQGDSLENVVAVVVRDFGGTELGVGGLARAYGEAAKKAVAAAGVETTVPRETFTVGVDYDDSGTVRGILDSVDVSFSATYEAAVTFEVTAPVDRAADIRDRLRSATSGRVDITDV